MNDEIPDFDRIDAAANQMMQADNVIPINNQEPENQEPEISTSELIAPILNIGFATLAPNWKISGEEVEQLSQAYGALLDKYLPDNGLDKYGPEISAIMVTAMIVMPRAAIPRKHKKIEKIETKHQQVKMEAAQNES